MQVGFGRRVVSSFVFLLSLAFVGQVQTSFAQGDLTPAMVAETASRIETQYGMKLLFLDSALQNVPTYKADSAFLGKYGSSMGIYFRQTLYLNSSLFDSKGVDVSSPVNFGVLVHEGWHAYYDQVMNSTNRSLIERIWADHYGTAGKNWDDSVWIGDEAVGNYLQGLSSIYANLASRKQTGKTISVSLKRIYQESYDGKEVYGYDDQGDMAPLPISPKEVAFILKVMGNAFPPPADLEKVLDQRFPPKP